MGASSGLENKELPEFVKWKLHWQWTMTFRCLGAVASVVPWRTSTRINASQILPKRRTTVRSCPTYIACYTVVRLLSIKADLSPRLMIRIRAWRWPYPVSQNLYGILCKCSPVLVFQQWSTVMLLVSQEMPLDFEQGTIISSTAAELDDVPNVHSHPVVEPQNRKYSRYSLEDFA